MLETDFVPEVDQLSMSLGETLFCSLDAFSQLPCLQHSLGIVRISEVWTFLYRRRRPWEACKPIPDQVSGHHGDVVHKWSSAVPSLKDHAVACPEVSPNFLDEILLHVGRSETADNSANEGRETADERACSAVIPQQDLS